tara:strand:- start:7148 stop:8080 length:933 start_codon:yes stop_codon:yes gene_type:complete
MKLKQLKIYNSKVNEGVNNEYPTPIDAFKQPCLHMIVGQRTSGKSYLTSKILEQAHHDKTFDVIYIITPSFNSNKAYFGKYITEENVYEPTKASITEVIKRVESDRDEWESFLERKKMYEKYKKDIKSHIDYIPDNDLIYYHQSGMLDNTFKKPIWKYNVEVPPRSCLILDDCLGSGAIMQSSGLVKLATLNRHVGPLKEDHSGRSACGLAVIILVQTYRMNSGIGRALRENLSLLTLFKNKQQKQLEAIKEELANVVNVEIFDRAYEESTAEKYGNLTVDFNPKCTTKTFRKNLNQLILFDELKCACKK